MFYFLTKPKEKFLVKNMKECLLYFIVITATLKKFSII